MSTTPVREIEIEKAWERRINHARDMYNMAVQAAEVELDAALAEADSIQKAELAEARHEALRAVDGHKELAGQEALF